MATNLPPNAPINPFAQFDAVATEILQTFDPLIAQLIARRDALLHKLSQLREDYTTKETTRKAAIQELETTRQQLQQMSLKINKNIPIHQKATELYQQGLEDLVTPTRLPIPHFSCPTLQTLWTLVSEFGEVSEWEVPDYSKKLNPTVTAGKKGKGVNELDAYGLSIDETNELIYIADFNNSRVQVVSFKGKFVTSFGQEILKSPWGIAVTGEDILVTDTSHHSLFLFDKKSMKLKNRTGTEGKEGELNDPSGLSIDTNGDVFVADSWNNRISIFSKALEFKNLFGTEQLRLPLDVKLTNECVVVLDWSPNCINFFSRNGTLLSSCISRGRGQDCSVEYPYFFCLDPAENIIISDTYSHAIKIFSKSGQRIHTIGKEGNGKGEFIKPYGVCMSQLGTIFGVSENPNYSMQCF